MLVCFSAVFRHSIFDFNTPPSYHCARTGSRVFPRRAETHTYTHKPLEKTPRKRKDFVAVPSGSLFLFPRPLSTSWKEYCEKESENRRAATRVGSEADEEGEHSARENNRKARTLPQQLQYNREEGDALRVGECSTSKHTHIEDVHATGSGEIQSPRNIGGSHEWWMHTGSQPRDHYRASIVPLL